jgi:hypothetical protein
VQRLVEASLVNSRNVGRSRLLSANPMNRATAPLTRLLELTFGPQTVVEEEFATVPGAELVIIFGSWAARYHDEGGSPPHDLDVLVVGDVDRAAVYEAADRTEARLGMEVNPVVRSSQQWNGGGDPLVDEIKASPFVTVLTAGEGKDA